LKVVSEFVTSAAGAAGFPKDGVPELAMVGRSNVGKSTLINALVRQKLARTSAAPGKTRLANFYRVTVAPRPAFYLVDLPGYGYARGGEKSRQEFDALAAEYFHSRHRSVDDAHSMSGVDGPALSELRTGETGPKRVERVFCGVFALVDCRHPGLDADRIAWSWLSTMGIERYVVATKLDKLTRAERHRHLSELERLYSGPVMPVSAETGEGLDALWTKIATLTTTRP
jgi:GTP-binding protein